MLKLFLIYFIINQGEFSISPLYFEIKAPSGARRKVTISVINETYTERIKIFLSRADVIETEAGVYKPVPIGQGVPSCAQWLKFKDSIIELGPQSGKEIDVFVEIPAGIKGGRYGAITFETRPSPEERKYRTQVPVYFEITIQPEIKPKLYINDIKIVEEIEKELRFMFLSKLKDAIAILVSTKNEGDIHAVVRGSLILRDKKGKKIKEFPLGGGRGVILPTATVELASIIKRPPPGEYLVDAIIRYGTLSPAKAQATFTILPKKIEKKEIFIEGTVLLSVKPEMIEMPVLPGAFRMRTIILLNEDDKEIKVKGEIRELINDEEGNLSSSDSFGYEYSGIKFISLEEEEFILKPGEKKVLKIKFTIPKEESSGGRYASLILNVKKEEEKVLPLTYEIPIFLNFLGKAKEEVKLEKIEVTGRKPVGFYFYLENTGDIHLKPTGSLQISEKVKTGAGEKMVNIGELKLKELKGYLLPKRKIKMATEESIRLKSGTYLIKVFINYGKDKELIYEKEMRL